MKRISKEQSRRALHQAIASDRLIKQGKSLEETNQHVSQTSDRELVEENLEWLDERRKS